MGISVQEVTEIGAIEFLNWWSYNKEEADYTEEKLQRIKNS